MTGLVLAVRGSGSREGTQQVRRRRELRRRLVDPSRQACGDLLEQEGVPVRVTEGGERAIARSVSCRTGRAPVRDLSELRSRRLGMEDLADLGTAGGEGVTGGADVRDDEVDPLGRARLLGGDPRAELDRGR